MTRLACHTSTTKGGDYCHVAKNETRATRRSTIMTDKHVKSVFYQGMNIISVPWYIDILYQNAYCLDKTLYRYCCKKRYQWVKNRSGLKTAPPALPVTIVYSKLEVLQGRTDYKISRSERTHDTSH